MAEQLGLEAPPPEPEAPVDEALERGARALYERDASRSISVASIDYVWPRVRKEYLAQMKAAREAMDDEPMPF